MIHAQEEERRRIGRELHDHISQTLGVLTIKLDQLRADTALPPRVSTALDELRQDTTEIGFTHEAVPGSLPSEVALCLFRVTEESLNNIAKHSHARSARVRVNGAPDGIHLTVDDTGRGFDLAGLQRRPGLGFVSMQERLRILRGTVLHAGAGA